MQWTHWDGLHCASNLHFTNGAMVRWSQPPIGLTQEAITIVTNGPVGPGTCETVFVVNIENGCECEPAVLNSMTKTDAGRAQANGTANLNITNVSLTASLWTPDLGVSNGWQMPARVARWYSRCWQLMRVQQPRGEIRVPIFRRLPQMCACVPSSGAMTVEVNEAPERVCLPVPLSIATQMELRVDGQLYDRKPQACDPELVDV
ncbi:MAG: hypothetical protein IPN76_06785 [Saprospiraceae bacterium]|nr:hypothetical protein [Saprospiraceae bacterium]